jgi:hypothetical protein
VDRLAIAVTDAFDAASFGDQIIGASRPRQHPSHIGSGLLPSRHYHPRQVASLVAMMHLLPLAMPDRKAMLDPAHLSLAMPASLDQQGIELFDGKLLRCALAHARRVQPVGLGQGALAAVVLGQTA